MSRPRMTAADYRHLQALERELGWEPTPIPPGMPAERWDWNRHGKPGLARFNRIMRWVITTEGAVGIPFFLRDAFTRDWTLAFVALMMAAAVVMAHLLFRKVYGVKGARGNAADAPPDLR